jgi:ubiquinone/menaquinone biosynthesis C-methylase UbiE
MSDSEGDSGDIAAFYALGLERDRLLGGQGALEFARTQVLLERYLPAPPAVIADVGGGPGRYAIWLAERGYQAHLVDPVPLHIEQARAATSRRPGVTLASAEVGDARALRLPDASVDAGAFARPPLPPARARRPPPSLAEARRVCRPGGMILAAAISRLASTLDGLRGWLSRGSDLRGDCGERPARRGASQSDREPAYFTTAYFHRPEELKEECLAVGLKHEATLGVEGPGWLLPELDARLADQRRRAALLDALASLEGEPALLGASAHLLAVARRT